MLTAEFAGSGSEFRSRVVTMDRNASDLRVLAAAMLEPVGRTALAEERSSAPATTGLALVARIEDAVGQWSTPVPSALGQLFESAKLTAIQPPAAMVKYVERIGCPVEGDGCRRGAQRATLLATVTAVPLGRGFEPRGEPFNAIARDVSETGISMLHTRAVNTDRLALQWQQLTSPARTITVVLRMLRCRPTGPFYELAGEFSPPE
jgi:hypothetical protein